MFGVYGAQSFTVELEGPIEMVPQVDGSYRTMIGLQGFKTFELTTTLNFNETYGEYDTLIMQYFINISREKGGGNQDVSYAIYPAMLPRVESINILYKLPAAAFKSSSQVV